MAKPWIDVATTKRRLASLFGGNREDFSRFGSTVNQVFEAFVFAQLISWYRQHCSVEMVNPRQANATDQSMVRLKFSTRGRPDNYSYARCSSRGGKVFQIRHQLRVATRHYKEGGVPPANICLDVAVIEDISLDGFSSSDHVPNRHLVTFGEAKHMSAFAELVAGFVGTVHEIQPQRLRRKRAGRNKARKDPAPFLFVSGWLWRTAQGIVQTLQDRNLDVEIYTAERPLFPGLPCRHRQVIGEESSFSHICNFSVDD